MINKIDFYEQFIKVIDKNRNLVSLKLNPVQRKFHAERTGKDVILKARQMGMSTYILADNYKRAITGTENVAIISHEDKSTQRFRRVIDRFYKYQHFGLADLLGVDLTKLNQDEIEEFRNTLLPKRHYSNSVITSFPEFDSEIEVYTAGSKNTGRSGSYSIIHASEIAFWPEAELIIAGLMQGGNPEIIMESTPNGASGYFYDLCMELLTDRKDFKLHFYPWWVSPEYNIPLTEPLEDLNDEENYLIAEFGLTLEQINWRRTKQKQLKGLFIQEYPENPKTCFIVSGNSYFGDLSSVFSIKQNEQTPNSDFRYYAGLDFAQDADYTVLTIFCKDTLTQVDFLRVNKLSWAEIRRRIVEKCKKWNVQKIVAEQNSMGKSQIEELRRDFRSEDHRVLVVPFLTNHTSKQMILSTLYESLHEGNVKLIYNPQQIREFESFVAKQNMLGNYRYEAISGENDDFVISNALGVYAMLTSRQLAF